MIPLWLFYVAVVVALAITLGRRIYHVRQAHERLAAFKRRQLGL